MQAVSEMAVGPAGGVPAPTPTAEPVSAAAAGWDDFVLAAPGGDIVQTAAWAAAKRALGFEVCPVAVRAGGDVVGGAQIVIKRFGPFGGVGYVARGPVIAVGRGDAASAVLDELERAARAAGVRHLVVQPPEGGSQVTDGLVARGYALGAPAVAPTATMRIDLTPPRERIIARMSSSKRSQIRRGQREGIEIRLGGPEDIPLFHALHEVTARRQGFAPISQVYLQHHWEALQARGWMQLVFACHEGRALAGIWLSAFGDTVTHRLSGWNLEGRHLQPNVACRWGVIEWAKAAGYRYYDLGGIERHDAELIAAGRPLPKEFHATPAALKRELGGEAVVLPEAMQRTFNPLARWLVRALYPRLRGSQAVHRLIHQVRNG